MKESEKKGKNYQKDYLARKRSGHSVELGINDGKKRCYWSGCWEVPEINPENGKPFAYCRPHRIRLSLYQKQLTGRRNEQARLWREHERAVHNNGIIERVK
jgi:hypothetical protein